MELAFDTFQNQLVFAHDCERNNFLGHRYIRDRYVCPCCEDGVFLAAGEIQSAHFKHHQGAPDCEMRVAGMAQGIFRDIEAEARDINLLAKFSTQVDGMSCDFVLRYRPSHSVDAIRVHMDDHDKSYQLHGRQEIDVPISKVAEHFIVGVIVSGQTVARRIVKAFGDTPVLFRHGSKTSVKLPENRVIRPGRYVACFPQSKNILFPVACKAEELKCPLGLKAISFIIPGDFNQRIKSFCLETFGMEVHIRYFNSSLITPLAVSEAAPDCWTTSTEGEAQIAISSLIRNGYPTQVVVQYRDRVKLVTETSHINLDDLPYILKINIGKQRPLIRIGMGNPVQFLTELRFLESFPEPMTTRFRFRFQKIGDSEIIERCRSSSDLVRMLIQVRKGQCEIASILYPPVVKLSASNLSRRTNLSPESQAADLTALLRSSDEPLWIEASGYKSLLVPRQQSIPASKPWRALRNSIAGRVIAARRRQAQAFRMGVCSAYSAYISKQ